METPLIDISSKTDIEKWVRTFYKELLSNEEMQIVFEGLDFEKHIPHIVQFWALVLLDEEGYSTNVFDKHIHLPIKEHHFEIWLQAFEKVSRQLFIGEKVELAIQRANLIAYTFKNKLMQMGKI
jgi:hemoglobin